VRGFALTLGIGVILSMFMAMVVTRALLELLAGWAPFRNRSLLGLNPGMEKA
jgi:preprotein translocase subunit SecD